MPTRKMTELEKFLLWARQASDDDLQQAIDIINIERRIRAQGKKPQPAQSSTKKASKKAANQPPKTDAEGTQQQQQE